MQEQTSCVEMNQTPRARFSSLLVPVSIVPVSLIRIRVRQCRGGYTQWGDPGVTNLIQQPLLGHLIGAHIGGVREQRGLFRKLPPTRVRF